jgi:membrane associated rhomboid family serine protease
MFPLRDDNPTLHTSVATFVIVGINVAVWVFVQRLGMYPELLETVWRLGVIPAELLGTVEPGTRVAADPRTLVVLDGVPNWWSVLTSMFAHGGWMHIIGNMWFLIVFGDNVEDAMGPLRFIVFYVLCGLAAVAVQVLSGPGSMVPMVGASGAIGGVMGAYMVLYPMAPVHLLVILGFYVSRIVVPAVFMLGYWFLLQLVAGAVDPGRGGIAFWAHVGGFVAGVVLVRLFCGRDRLGICRRRRGRTVRAFPQALRRS